MEQYFGVAIAVAILFVAVKYYQKRKADKVARGAGTPSDPRPPTQEK